MQHIYIRYIHIHTHINICSCMFTDMTSIKRIRKFVKQTLFFVLLLLCNTYTHWFLVHIYIYIYIYIYTYICIICNQDYIICNQDFSRGYLGTTGHNICVSLKKNCFMILVNEVWICRNILQLFWSLLMVEIDNTHSMSLHLGLQLL